MWLLNLAVAYRETILGEFTDEMSQWLQQVASGMKQPVPPISLSASATETACCRYGPCGPAVVLFMQLWQKVAWGINEGQAHPEDSLVIRVQTYEEVLNPSASRRWRQALLDAGYRSEEPYLQRVWEDAGKVGESVGGHHARFLAAAMCGELAQAHERDLGFFLAMMPWVRAGHWPGGWEDATNRLKVF